MWIVNKSVGHFHPLQIVDKVINNWFKMRAYFATPVIYALKTILILATGSSLFTQAESLSLFYSWWLSNLRYTIPQKKVLPYRPRLSRAFDPRYCCWSNFDEAKIKVPRHSA